ncbi:hypothetical protein RJ640_009040 [Escallonia rubra]|uniref:Protein LNK1 n=1 Tax=Escallonia rubra TaxID=112253 RepID=A0AA88RA47_9ASTE|nr:hypothetical protein RJ640_009040 [Escallonia rubra]
MGTPRKSVFSDLLRVQEGSLSKEKRIELEDIVWDEFGQSDDHIVPHPSDEHAHGHAFQGDNHKKSRHEVSGVSVYAGEHAAKRARQGKEERDFGDPNQERSTMLENDGWSQEPDDVSALGDKCPAIGDNSYNYSLSQISQTDEDLSFFDNDCEGKESGDLLYYGWPDIGNFEDVDRMFRSCDSSFGLGVTGNEDELGWFPSSDAIEGSEDLLKPDYKFQCPESNAFKHVSEMHEPLKLNDGNSSINDHSLKSASVICKANTRPSKDDKPGRLGKLPYVDGSDQVSESRDDFSLKEQGVELNSGVPFKVSTKNSSKSDRGMINTTKKQPKHQNRSQGKRKDQCSANGDSFQHLQSKDVILPSGDTSHQIFTSLGIRQQKQNLGLDSCGYLQPDTPYVYSDYCHPSDQTTISPALSGIKSENTGLTSLSSKESSYASNQIQSLERSHDPSFDVTALTPNSKRGKLNHQQGLQSSFTSDTKHMNFVVPGSICDPVSVRTQVHHIGNEFGNQGDITGVSLGNAAELGCSNVEANSSMSSGLEEISLEATSFRQLQQVMEQLDLRTKLCIRDSLYRLARSAEQRHNYASLSVGSGDDGDTSGAFLAEGTNKPSDSSAKPSHDALPVKSHAMIHGSISNLPMIVEQQLVCHEEAAAETERNVVDH